MDIEPNERFLIPDLLLKVEEPSYTGEWVNTLGFQYHYETYLKSIFTRFVVRMYPYIYKKMWWKNGVVLEHEGSEAILRFDSSNKKVIINIRGENIKNRRNLLAIIRKEFKEIHGKFAVLNVTEFVAHPTFKWIDKDGKEKELLRDYQRLLKMEAKGKLTEFADEIEEDVPISDWLDGIETQEERRQNREGGAQEIEQHERMAKHDSLSLQNTIRKLEKELKDFDENIKNYDEDAQTIARFKALRKWLVIAVVSFVWIGAVIYFGWGEMEIWTWVIAILTGLVVTAIACWKLDENYTPLLPSKIFEQEKQRIYKKHGLDSGERDLILRELGEAKRKFKSLKE